MSCMETPVNRAMSRLATIDGTRRRKNASRRFLRQPATTSKPRSSFSSIRGMSAGSFCRSPSRVATTWPRATSKPAAMAAVWPKFRRNLTTRTRGSLRRSSSMMWRLASWEQSSTKMISEPLPVRPIPSSTVAISS